MQHTNSVTNVPLFLQFTVLAAFLRKWPHERGKKRGENIDLGEGFHIQGFHTGPNRTPKLQKTQNRKKSSYIVFDIYGRIAIKQKLFPGPYIRSIGL